MDQVYIIDKSLQQRLREYKDVISGFEVVPASALTREWGFYLESTIDPNGWQAIWKISRATCESLRIPFPTIVSVFVLNIDFSKLEAQIKVIAVQGDIHIPEKHYVPLIQLWPTKLQDKSVGLNLSSTANFVDMVRFFYLHLLMPWDLQNDTKWKTEHLESRLRLYYDMKNGIIPKATAERLNSILTEARHLQKKKEMLEIELDDSDTEEGYNPIHINALANIHLRLLEIKNEVEILQNPLLREALVRRDKKQIPCNTDSRESEIWVIHKSSLVDDYLTFLEQVELLYPNSKVTLEPNLSVPLKNRGANDCFILSEGKYEMDVIGALDSGGTLKGLGCRNSIILVSTLEDIMFDFQGQSLIENLTLNASISQYATVVRKGKVTFSNCIIFGDNQLTTQQGIIVLAGGELELINCELFGFFTAIVGNSGSKITLQDTVIHDVHFGLKIFDNALVNIHKCLFSNCQDYAVSVETEKNLDGDKHRVGDFDVLQMIPKVTTEFMTGNNNVKGNVVINHLSQISAIEDLFSNQDPTVSEGPSEEDMVVDDDATDNELEQTILEKVCSISPATV